MSQRTRGFTLIEIMIVIAIIAVIAAIAIPNLAASKLTANETAAIATLKALHTAQAQFQQRAVVDRDSDGTGEYGSFGEMAGVDVPRSGPGQAPRPLLSPTVLSSRFGQRQPAWGHVQSNGYYFQVYLPRTTDALRHPAELNAGPFEDAVDADFAEVAWCAYAWPQAYGQSGNRTFCINQEGVVVTTDHPGYEGAGIGTNRPEGDGAAEGAAFILRTGRPGTDARSMLGSLAIGTAGGDGNIWLRVE